MFGSLTKKSLGQHWLKDQKSLSEIVAAANLSKSDTVLEIGPGQGDLTKQLVKHVKQVIAVEVDSSLAEKLPHLVLESNLEVVQSDILRFDLFQMPVGYKVVASIPYYLTSHLIRFLSESINPPSLMVLLVQKEVAQRIAAQPGQMSLLSVSSQLYYQPQLGLIVPAQVFIPPPNVDSQLIILKKRPKPLFSDLDSNTFFRLVKAGFAGRRKKLRSSLAAGLRIDKKTTDDLLQKANIIGDLRAQNLSLEDWYKLSKVSAIIKKS